VCRAKGVATSCTFKCKAHSATTLLGVGPEAAHAGRVVVGATQLDDARVCEVRHGIGVINGDDLTIRQVTLSLLTLQHHVAQIKRRSI